MSNTQQNHPETSTRKQLEGMSVRKPDVSSADFKHGNPVAKQPDLAPSVTGSSFGSHDLAHG